MQEKEKIVFYCDSHGQIFLSTVYTLYILYILVNDSQRCAPEAEDGAKPFLFHNR